MWHSIFGYWHLGAGGGLSLAVFRLALWLVRRGRTPTKRKPIIGWMGHLLVNETLLAVMTMRFLTEQAKRERETEASGHLITENQQLRRIIAELEAGFHSGPSDGSSSASLAEILTRSPPPTALPPANSNEKPGANPPTSTTTSATS